MSSEAAYEAVPYLGKAEPLTHPDFLWRTARVHGIEAAPPARARVLEIGCGDGSNLVGLAAALPEARFVGIDRSRAAMAKGAQAKEALGLDNLELVPADLARVQVDPETFDYVVAHGFASWVPRATLERALQIARQALQPSGVLYLSYNVPVAWGLRGALREAMIRAARHETDLGARIRRARQVVQLLGGTLGEPSPGDHYSQVLARELKLLREAPDHAILHDYLSPDNHAYSFEQMASLAVGAGLLPATELRPIGRDPRVWRVRWRELAKALEDAVGAELLSDVLDRRAFRATLFRRGDLRPGATVHAAELMHRGELAARLGGGASGAAGASATFQTPRGDTLHIEGGALAKALHELARAWPGGRTLAALEPDEAERRALARSLSELLSAGHLELRTVPPPVAATVGERPAATALARFEAANRPYLTNVRHEPLSVDGAARAFIASLDGSETLEQLESAHGEAVSERLEALRVEGLLAPPASE